MKKLTKIGLGIIVLFLILVVLAASSGNNQNQAPAQTTPATSEQKNEETPVVTPEVTQTITPPETKALTILDSKLGKEQYGGNVVTGTAIAGKDLTYAEVDVKFYDKDGVVLQSGIANINNLKYGERWNFKVYGPFEGQVSNYQISVGNCF